MIFTKAINDLKVMCMHIGLNFYVINLVTWQKKLVKLDYKIIHHNTLSTIKRLKGVKSENCSHWCKW